MKRFDLARDDGLAALSVPNHPWRFEVLDKLARCYIALGDPDAALEQVNAALEIKPLEEDMLALHSATKSMRSDLQQSRASWDRKEWLDAKQALLRAIAGCTGDCPIQWRIWTVEAEVATMNWDGAVRAAEALAELHPIPHALGLLGLAKMLSNDLKSCLEPLQSALRLDSKDVLASRTLYRAREIERLKGEGEEAFKSGKYSDAVEKYTDALNIIGSDEESGKGGYLRAVVLANRAAALLSMGRPARAFADVVISLDLQPMSLKALHTHASVRMAQGFYEEAVTIYTETRKVWMAGERDAAEGRMIAQGWQDAEAALKSSQSKDYHGILRRV
ncbi:hypothetical protein FRB98_005174 [Tulasnella sp. 332]|nr:hypothetical protein FRB98_005174 [Tulasnella sp. 332]